MYRYRAKILKIIDGDTLDVDIDLGFHVILSKQRIRLYGIDTPESRTTDKIEKSCGLLSKHFLEQLCPIGSFIELKSYDTGKFGRIIGEVFEYNKSDISINQRMCDENLAVPYFGQSKEEIKEAHLVNREILIQKGML